MIEGEVSEVSMILYCKVSEGIVVDAESRARSEYTLCHDNTSLISIYVFLD